MTDVDVAEVAVDAPLLVTRVRLATLLSTTPDRVSKWIAEGLPVVATGGGRGKATVLDLAEALPWLWSRQADPVEQERQRYFKLQADKTEQEIRRKNGELVDAAAVDRHNAARTLAARERLLQLPATALQRGLIETVEEEDQLRALVDEALLELAAKGGYVEP